MMDFVVVGNNKFKTSIAITEDEQAVGLMFKHNPEPMCFPFKGNSVHKFWMKNTYAPLDIIFCRAGKVIDICKGEPLSLDFVGPNEVTDLVIELPAGTVAASGISKGDAVSLKYSIKTLAKEFSYRLQLLT